MKKWNKAVLIAISLFMMISGMTIKADEETITITSWSFDDEKLIKEDDVWYLNIDESDIPQIETLLPKTIIAVFSDENQNTADEETTDDETSTTDNVVNITWENTNIDTELDSQVLHASLPSNYALANSEEKIAITLTIDKDDPVIEEETEAIVDEDTETVIEEEPITTYSITDFDDLIINKPKPSGTVINLFDYWSEAQDTERKNITEKEATSGINKGHSLKFGNQLGQADANDWEIPALPEDIAESSINSWTKSAHPHTGIVNNNLDSGYPILIEGKNANLGENIYDSHKISATTSKESLAYLFSPYITHEGKEIHSDAKGLLTIDDNGYYHFDSKNTFAKFDEDTDSFTLYDTSSKPDSKNCQFFPFNEISDLYKIEYNELKDIGINLQEDTAINHFFGMTMTTKFIQPEGGVAYNNVPITYNFSGDDDVWIFIDDVLVADLGGVHDALSVEINFKTGDVIVYKDANQNNKYDSGDNSYNKSTLGEIFTHEKNTSNLEGSTFADNTYHTMKFFYLERGGNESNLSLRFNLIPVPESEITKVDQEGNPISNVDFALYRADENYKYDEATDEIWEGSSDEDGNVIVTDKNTGRPITFKELKQENGSDYDYYVLKEINRPSGYSSVGTHHLKYEKSTGVVLSDGHFETSSYAQPKVTTSLSDNTLYKYGDTNEELYTFDSDSNLPIIHALVFKKENNIWVPVTGNVVDGWEVWENDDAKTITEAIKENGSDNTFIPTTNGMQVTIEDLPGDIKNYYWYIIKTNGKTEDAEYNVRYYFEDDKGNMTRIADKNLDRVFSTHVIVSNTKNYLAVEKVDENGNALDGVIFALYKENDIVNAIDSETNKVNYDNLNGITPYDSGTTASLSRENGQKLNGKGLIVFPSEGKILEEGTYYLVETKTLDGYVRNDIATKIIVGDDGVFADAGEKDDGIKTRVVVGSILKSMLRFVVDKGIDTTLSNIKVQLTDRENHQWKDNVPAVHFKYNSDRNNNEWGLEYDGQESDMEALVSDTGINELIIRQCTDTEHKNGEGNYTNLNDSDISNLFSTLTYVIYTNDKVDDTDGGSGTTDPEEPDNGDPDNGNGTQEPDNGDPDNGNGSQKPEPPTTDNDPVDDRPINDHDELTCAEKYGDGYIWSDEYNACIPGAIVIVDTSAR